MSLQAGGDFAQNRRGAYKFLSELASAPAAQRLFFTRNNRPVNPAKPFPLVLMGPRIKRIQDKNNPSRPKHLTVFCKFF